ncbi:MAG TPA: hypothetical protein VHY31_09055 [Streptosporangiaceae bacterium]|jgi:hypothetical protein|nr:hypothetical protein [Streptosporangiaceae bacterium]
MNETQLIEQLHAAMDDVTAGLRAPQDAAQHARARGRRHRTARGLLATVTAAGAAASLAIILAGPGAPSHPAAAAGRHATIETTSFVLRSAEAALADVNGFIVKSSVIGAPGQIATTTYLDPVTGTTRSVSPGGVTYWTATTVKNDRDYWHTTEINTSSRTWWVMNDHSSGRLGQLAPNAPLVPSISTSVAQIRTALSEGQFRVAHHGVVNGRRAIELVYAGALGRKGDALHFWIDAKTFRPVALVFPPFSAASTITESWVAKTPALAKQTNTPHIPSGFRKVTAPHWSS